MNKKVPAIYGSGRVPPTERDEEIDGIVQRIRKAMEDQREMKTRCKLVCSLVDQGSKTVYLYPVYSGSEENKQFFAATPGGTFIMNVLNPAALATFEQGKEYYVDFSPAE